MLIIPTKALPNQNLQVQLADQACSLNIYQLDFGLFMDVSANRIPLAAGVICENLNRIVRYAYLGLIGDFVFVDSEGDSDPVYTGLGTRFQLVWLDQTDLSII